MGYGIWVITLFLLSSHPKGRPSIRLAYCLGITWQSAWFLDHHLRQGWTALRRRLPQPRGCSGSRVVGSRGCVVWSWSLVARLPGGLVIEIQSFDPLYGGVA